MLPLLHSLTHLTYLTSTSPRIRDILVVDGGLERLLEILKESALPRRYANTEADWYSLRGPHTATIINYNQQISLRHSLAFQCVVNIGVRGSENVRTRLVQSGALDVVAQIMEVWLQGKGVSIEPGSLGSQAAVDRAAAGGSHPWNLASRSRERHRERATRERERQARTHSLPSANEAATTRSSPSATATGSRNASAALHHPAGRQASQQQPFQQHQATGSSPSTIAAGRVITKESLEMSLLPEDQPSPADIVANMLSIEQRAAITRIHAVSRLAGIDKSFLKRLAFESDERHQGLVNMYRSFGLDLRVLMALHGGNIDSTEVITGFIGEPPRLQPLVSGQWPSETLPLQQQHQQHSSAQMSGSQNSGSTGGDDVSMDSASDQNESFVPAPSLRRSGTITLDSLGRPPPLRSQSQSALTNTTPSPSRPDQERPTAPLQGIEQPTPRAAASTLPLARSRTVRAASPSIPAPAMRTLLEGARASPITSASTSTVSSLNDQPNASPAHALAGSNASGADLYDRPVLASRRSSTRTTMYEAASISSTPPVNTPPPPQAQARITHPATQHPSHVAPDNAVMSTYATTETTENRTDRERDVQQRSRAGTEEDEESTVGEDPVQISGDQDVGIVGTGDHEAVEALSGLVEVEDNDRTQVEVDLAMGAPPGAPGATQTPRVVEMTPRQPLGNNALPATGGPVPTGAAPARNPDRHETTAFAAVIAAGAPRGFTDLSDLVNVIESTTPAGEVTYSDDTILLCLQLLAYLSKYLSLIHI